MSAHSACSAVGPVARTIDQRSSRRARGCPDVLSAGCSPYCFFLLPRLESDHQERLCCCVDGVCCHARTAWARCLPGTRFFSRLASLCFFAACSVACLVSRADVSSCRGRTHSILSWGFGVAFRGIFHFLALPSVRNPTLAGFAGVRFEVASGRDAQRLCPADTSGERRVQRWLCAMGMGNGAGGERVLRK